MADDEVVVVVVVMGAGRFVSGFTLGQITS